jgi:Mrp family chromosome partitioning ATPase
VNALAEIPTRSSRDVRGGVLRRTELEAFGKILDRNGRGSLLVTGAGDGPLALSTGLAGAAAARGIRTALVECDLTVPSLAGALGLNPRPGLSEYLGEEAEAQEVLQPLVLAGPASAGAAGPLICIVAGERGAGTPLETAALQHALSKLRHAYELVVLHGPPLADETGTLREAASGADALLACVGPQLASGRPGRKVGKALRRLPVESAGLVVYGGNGRPAGA